jgi:hypothetical protein
MRPGPIRRLLGTLGLLALAPIGWRLLDGSLAPADAAVRAVVTLVLVAVLGRILGMWVSQVAHGYDPHAGTIASPRPGTSES